MGTLTSDWWKSNHVELNAKAVISIIRTINFFDSHFERLIIPYFIFSTTPALKNFVVVDSAIV